MQVDMDVEAFMTEEKAARKAAKIAKAKAKKKVHAPAARLCDGPLSGRCLTGVCASVGGRKEGEGEGEGVSQEGERSRQEKGSGG